MAVDSELPMVIKAYFYLSASSTATVATASLDATYSSGGFDENFGFLDFGASTGDGVFGTWTQSISAVYPTQVVTSARVREPAGDVRPAVDMIDAGRAGGRGGGRGGLAVETFYYCVGKDEPRPTVYMSSAQRLQCSE